MNQIVFSLNVSKYISAAGYRTPVELSFTYCYSYVGFTNLKR